MKQNSHLSLMFIPALLMIFAASGFSQSSPYQRYAVGLHYDSNVSGGMLPPEQMVQLSIDNRMDAVVFCDHLQKEVEFGLRPLRKILKKRVAYPSVTTFGVEQYIQLMDSLNGANPGITIIPGTEVGPSYYWSGHPLDKSLKLHNWHQHMLVFGVENPEVYENMPGTLANKYREELYERTDRVIGAGVVIVVGIFLFFFVVKKKIAFSSQTMKVGKHPYRFIGIILIIGAVILLFNDYPFRKKVLSQYESGHCGEAAQAVINHVISNGGLIYYAHPEAEFSGQIGWINCITHPYANLLMTTRNYTGFAIFAEGWKVAGVPGGLWDRTLYQYCNGERSKPVWAVAEVDFEGNLPANFIREACTYVWAENKSKESIMEALKKGRCYAAQIWGPNMIWMDHWSIDNGEGAEKISGETLNSSGLVNLHFGFTVAEDKENFEVFVIRNGRQVANIPFDDSFDMALKDIPPGGNTYYRLWVLYKGLPVIASNPIFVNSAGLQTEEIDS